VCLHCGESSVLISQGLGLCARCVRRDFAGVLPTIEEARSRARAPFRLPDRPPRADGGRRCHLCANECRLALGETGFCGLRTSTEEGLAGATADVGNVSWYYDPLPANCVADWVCPGGSGAGYPEFAYTPGPEHGYRNLAVFYQACSFDCLFCQNWRFRDEARSGSKVRAGDLAAAVDELTSCICYFGGDPTPQLPHALRASRLALESNEGRILRICWETNGSMHPALLRQAADISLLSGGCIKFDLKAWSEELHIALCGASNRRTLDNFRLLAGYAAKRATPPFLIASTLLVPGYIDREEVSRIAAFIASLDPNIPYALLAFHPQFAMSDLPPTSRHHARVCLEAAWAQGLSNVRVGNIHLLGDYY